MHIHYKGNAKIQTTHTAWATKIQAIKAHIALVIYVL